MELVKRTPWHLNRGSEQNNENIEDSKMVSNLYQINIASNISINGS